MSYLRDREEHQPGSVKWAYQILKGFYNETGKKWPLHPKDVDGGPEPKRPFLETEEAEAFMEMAKGNTQDYAMFRLVLITGIRKKELRELNVGDFRYPRISIETAKGGERRIRTLDDETADAIRKYVNGPRMIWGGRNNKPDSPLFLSPTGRRLPESTLTKWFRRYMRMLGKPKGCGMHALRRTVVTWEAGSGMTDLEIQKLHGWKSSKMPSVYARLKPEVLEREAYEANPLIRGR